jgi:uncharacterized protein (TIGR02058 family)
VDNIKRYLVEFGTGVDIHGGDCTKAAVRALKDAVSHCCMTGILEVLQLKNVREQMRLKVKVAAPFPQKIDSGAVLASLPGGGGNAELEIVEGGLTVEGLHVGELGEGDTIVIVNASITVLVDAP